MPDKLPISGTVLWAKMLMMELLEWPGFYQLGWEFIKLIDKSEIYVNLHFFCYKKYFLSIFSKNPFII